MPFLRQVETFPDGDVLLDWCNNFGFEGVVSKRLSSRYASGPSRNWVKVKCPGCKRDNAERFRMFEGQSKPQPSERERALRRNARSSPAFGSCRPAKPGAREPGSTRPFWSRKSLNWSRPDPAHQLVRQAVNHIVGLRHPCQAHQVWPHMLRHGCGHALADKDVDFRVLQDYLGHRDPAMTTRCTRVADKAV